MNKLSFKNNQLKFKTSRDLPISLEITVILLQMSRNNEKGQMDPTKAFGPCWSKMMLLNYRVILERYTFMNEVVGGLIPSMKSSLYLTGNLAR
jgi:hypothetical protein